MARVEYNKLVRDNIKDKIERAGDICSIRTIIDEAEFISRLRQKLIEEANELAISSSRAEFLAEYCDLMVVLDALTGCYEISEAELRVAMAENVEKKGLFKNRQLLEWTESATT